MKWPLMYNNITDSDINALIHFLSQKPIPKLTNGKKVKEFEQLWSKWLGTKYSVFVNSGSSANIITLAVIKEMLPSHKREVIVSPLNWVSDISAIIHAGMTPVFCDIKFENLAMNEEHLLKLITPRTGAILLTHILGYNGLTQSILDVCHERNIFLIGDACESHGTTFNGKKVGSLEDISNFSFFYAHHASTIEGGMICTNSETIYEQCRILRSHGMLREGENESYKKEIIERHPTLNPDFIFLQNAYNMRSTELNAVLGINQLTRLDDNNHKRKRNLDLFLNRLDPKKYYTEFNRTGNSNYAFTLLLRFPDFQFRDKVETVLRENGVEFRRGMSGGGNQLRQPYLTRQYGTEFAKLFPNVDHVHFYGWYIGNYPELPGENIVWLTDLLNNIT